MRVGTPSNWDFLSSAVGSPAVLLRRCIPGDWEADGDWETDGDWEGDGDGGLHASLPNKRLPRPVLVGGDRVACWGSCPPEDCSGCRSAALDCPLAGLEPGAELEPKAVRSDFRKPI